MTRLRGESHVPEGPLQVEVVAVFEDEAPGRQVGERELQALLGEDLGEQPVRALQARHEDVLIAVVVVVPYCHGSSAGALFRVQSGRSGGVGEPPSPFV